MNPFLRIVCLFSLVCGLLAGCAPQPGTSPSDAGQQPASGEPQNPALPFSEEDDSQATFVDDIEDTPGELPALGSITFIVDTAHQASGEFVPYGSGLELSLTDAAGLTWTLAIPPGALGEPQTITMTALSEVQSANIPGTQVGGVLLEPDGLWLDDPATLTVSGRGLEETALFLSGSHDGAQVNFAQQQEAGLGSGAIIQHFSSYTVVSANDPKAGQLREQEMGHYTELVQKARELLKDKNIKVPRPPAVPVTCPKDEDDSKAREKALKKFDEQFHRPEGELMLQMIAAQTALARMGRDHDLTLETRLLERQIKKVNLLIKEYGSQVEHVEPITRVGMQVAHNLAFVDPRHPGSVQLAEALGAMAERSIDKLLKELREKHEYRNVGAVMDMARRAALVGVSTIPLDDLIAKIESAMTFEVELTYELKIAGNQFWEIKGETSMRPDFESTGNLSWLHGLGMGEVVSFKNTREPSIIMKAPSFQFEVLFTSFDACKGTATLVIDRMAPSRETYIINEELVSDMPVVHNSWKATYEQYLQVNPMVGALYMFPVKLKNGDPVAVETEFTETAPKSKGQVVGTFRVKLVHEPGR